MRPRRAPVPLQLTRRAIAEGEIIVAYHVVPTDDQSEAVWATSFLSRAARGLPPRTWTQEGANPELAEGISAYRTYNAASETAREVLARGRSIGEYVAEVRLEPGFGITIAEWGQRGHLTIWADPLILRASTVDIVPI